jgi:hypothetical protein
MSSLSLSPSKMGCSASVSTCSPMMVSRHSPSPPVIPAEKRFGKITMINGDGSKIASGVLVPVGQITRCFGRIAANPVIKIKSDEDSATYDQVDWITKYKGKFVARSVYANDPAAAEAYAQAVFKLDHTPRPPRMPRSASTMFSPMRRTVFGVPQPPIQSLTLPPFPPKLI